MSRQEIPPRTGDGGEPSSPLELSPPGWKTSLRRTLAEFKADRGGLIAAGMAFYWFLAVFPALLAAVGVLGLVKAGPEAVDAISRGIRSTLPPGAAEVLTGAVERAGQQAGGAAVLAALVGLGLAVWSASAGMVAVQSGLNVAYDVGEDRPFIAQRVRALVLLVVTLVLAGVATAMLVFGQPIGEAIGDRVPLGGAFVVVWTILRWVIALGAVTVLFASLYYLAPNRQTPRWAWISPGGVVGTAIWLVASLGFSFYVSSFGSYGETYGSLAGVVVLLLWLFLSALAVVFGGELNAELERQGAVEAREEAPADGADGDGRATQAETDWAERMRRIRQ
jgi:membrane protein